eukprot:8378618-Pyramimonas_sp.AAC.1
MSDEIGTIAKSSRTAAAHVVKRKALCKVERLLLSPSLNCQVPAEDVEVVQLDLVCQARRLETFAMHGLLVGERTADHSGCAGRLKTMSWARSACRTHPTTG